MNVTVEDYVLGMKGNVRFNSNNNVSNIDRFLFKVDGWIDFEKGEVPQIYYRSKSKPYKYLAPTNTVIIDKKNGKYNIRYEDFRFTQLVVEKIGRSEDKEVEKEVKSKEGEDKEDKEVKSKEGEGKEDKEVKSKEGEGKEDKSKEGESKEDKSKEGEGKEDKEVEKEVKSKEVKSKEVKSKEVKSKEGEKVEEKEVKKAVKKTVKKK